MASSADLNCVEILIRAPSQRVDDFSLTCDLAWTVQKIKSHLSAHYPTHPGTDEQKLIYRGQLMRDHLQLKDIIVSNDEGRREIFHLVCQKSEPMTPPMESGSATGEQTTRSDSPRLEREPQPSVINEGVRFRSVDGQSSPYISNNYMQNSWQWHTQHTDGNPHHHAYIYYWQMYASHMAAAAAAAAAATHSRQTYLSTSPFVAAPSSAASQPSQESPTVGNGEDDANHDQRQPAAGANAGGDLFGDDDDDDQAPRDWLDRVYAVVRFCFMLTIFFFYCTPVRFTMLVVFSVLVMLYQGGFMRLQRARAARAAAQPQHAQGENNGENPGGVQTESTTPLNDAARPSMLSMFFGNVLAFFTSLIPAGVPQMAN